MTTIQGQPGTGKTYVLLALVLRALSLRQKALVTTDANNRLNICVTRFHLRLQAVSRLEEFDGKIFLVQRSTLTALGGLNYSDNSIAHNDSKAQEMKLHNLLACLAEEVMSHEMFSLTGYIKERLDKYPTEMEKVSYNEAKFIRAFVGAQDIIVESWLWSVGEQREELTAAQSSLARAWLNLMKYYVSNAYVIFATTATATAPIMQWFSAGAVHLRRSVTNYRGGHYFCRDEIL